jgi:hypothetical protein
MEGEFSFADMIRDDEARKGSDKEATSFASPKVRAYSGHGLRDEDKVDAMMPQQFTCSLQPAQCWDGKYNHELLRDAAGNLPDINAITTSFLPCGVSLAISSTTDFLTVKTMGVVQLRVLFSRDTSNGNGGEMKSEAKISGGQRRMGGNTQVQVTDVDVAPPSTSMMFSPSDSYNNNSPSHNVKALSASVTSLKTPWPCSKVEVMIMQRNSDFPCIVNVGAYSSSSIRSSAASTPAGKGKAPTSRLV